jgi:hypothetical protein
MQRFAFGLIGACRAKTSYSSVGSEIPSGQWRYYDGLLYCLARCNGGSIASTPDMPRLCAPPTPDPITRTGCAVR